MVEERTNEDAQTSGANQEIGVHKTHVMVLHDVCNLRTRILNNLGVREKRGISYRDGCTAAHTNATMNQSNE